MARIIPHDPSELLRTTCEACFSKIEYAPSEVKTHRDSDGDAYYHIVCPNTNCGKAVSVPHPIRGRK